MRSERLLLAFGKISDDFIEEAELAAYDNNGETLGERRKLRSKPLRAALIAAIIMVLLATTVLAAVYLYYGGLPGWLGGLWQSRTGTELNPSQEQTIIEHVVEAGQFAEDNGINVSVESILVGASNVRIMLGIEIEGITLSEDYQYLFDYAFAEVSPSPLEDGAPGDMGVSQKFYMVDSSTNKAYIVLNYSASVGIGKSLVSGFSINVELKGILEHTKDKLPVASYAGYWTFDIPLITNAPSKAINISQLDVTAYLQWIGHKKSAKTEITIEQISITTTGISFSHDAENEYYFDIVAILQDGTTIETYTGGGYLRPDNESYGRTYSWLVPIDLEQLESIQFCETTIQIH